MSEDLKTITEEYGKKFYDLLKFSILIIPSAKYGLIFPEYFEEMKKISAKINKEVYKKPFEEIVEEVLPELEAIEKKYKLKLQEIFKKSKEEIMRKKLEEVV